MLTVLDESEKCHKIGSAPPEREKGDVRWCTNVGEKQQQRKAAKEGKWLEILQNANNRETGQFQEKWPDQWILRRNQIEQIITEAAEQKARSWDGDFNAKNIWLSECPGIGKSRSVERQLQGFGVSKKDINKWWDGFDPSTSAKVLMEDYPAMPMGHCLEHHMKW
jgi:hypothetical protein